MRRDQSQLKLADLYIELNLARAFLLEAEKAYRMEHVESARELIALLMSEINSIAASHAGLKLRPNTLIARARRRSTESRR